MSDPKLIAPLLTDYLMGSPVSEHHGVCCCPAIRKESEQKYIVKIISLPASQVQLDALVLAGACKNEEEALNYFRELSESAVQEAELLQRLSRMEGFAAYDGWQIVPMEDRAGFHVYLLGAYKVSLERYFQRNPMTHLGAVNLGLDLCTALSVCRRNGYLYVDLKPCNVFITENNEYRIGDLGFIPLESLKYASLPDKYRSVYTAPEITDAYSALNATMDIYAVGLILYQAYNNGQLPPFDEPLSPPAYADYEMAEIILKACDDDPDKRWQDPEQMGQALVRYMQRNGANDTPIVPVPVTEAPVSPPVEEPEPEAQEIPAEEEPEEEIVFVESSDEESSLELSEEEPLPDEITDETPEDEADEGLADQQAAEETPEEPAEAEEEDESEEEPISEGISSDEADPNVQEISDEGEPEEEQFDDVFLTDETLPSDENSADIADAVLSDEVSEMLAHADELISHPLPDPVVAPEPIDVPIPPRIVAEPEAEDNPETEEVPEEDPVPAPQTDELEESSFEEDSEQSDLIPEEESETLPAPRKNHTALFITLLSILALLLLLTGAYVFYRNYYLQSILGMTVDGAEDRLTVSLSTTVDNSLLSVYCTDVYGNTLQRPVIHNKAHFEGLKSGTDYTVTVKISGFHKLVGYTSAEYTTDTRTNIVSFTAVAGDQDGSVILNFSLQEPDNTVWYVKYSAPGIPEQTIQCSGHMAIINGLNIGSQYTFQLVPATDLYVVGTDTLQFTASNVILPENLTIEGFDSNALVVTWDVPEGANVPSWTVRCYNSTGFDQTLTVTEPQVRFENLNVTESYTVDVQAEGMSVSERISVSANSITFKDILLDGSSGSQLHITWTFEGTAPKDGWRLFYTVDGGEKQIILCDKNTCTISPLIPGGHYEISFEFSEDINVFGGSAVYDAPNPGAFDSHQVQAGDMNFRMCRTPKDTKWRWYNLYERDFTNTFSVGEKASFTITLSGKYSKSDAEIHTLFIIRDSDGKIVSVNEGRSRKWNSMWTDFKGRTGTEFDVPSMPETPGNYTVEVFFDQAHVTTYAFKIR